MGHTRARRLVAALTAGMIGAAGAGVAMAQGGLNAGLALSGTIFKVTMGEANGTDFSLFVDSDTLGEDGDIPVSRLRFGEVTASDLCLSAKLGAIPGVGDVSFKLTSDGENTVAGNNLVVGAKVLQGDLTLQRPRLGADVSQRNPDAPPGSWGLISDHINVHARNIDATSLASDDLTVNNVSVTIERGDGNVCVT